MKPRIGVIARVKSKFNDPDTFLGPIDGSDGYTGAQPRVPVGTHVFVVKTWKEKGSRARHPVVVCEHGMGWLYWDELERVDEVQAG